jgi:hypothetical protein
MAAARLGLANENEVKAIHVSANNIPGARSTEKVHSRFQRVARTSDTPTKWSATRNAGKICQQVLTSSKIVRVQPVSHVQLPP